ncbi:MAG: TrmB family transcriptional regulator [Patescibacteria group bacterium]
MAELEARLQELGFSAYEARAYLALLQKNPATGYELSQVSGIPSAKIYETVNRLRARGAATALIGEPQRYVPLSPAALLGALRARFDASMAGLEEALNGLASGTETEYVWNIRGYDRIMERAAGLVRAAGREVALFAWADECRALAASLSEASARGIGLLGVVVGSIEGLPQLFRHGFEAEVLDEQGGKLMVLIRDGEEALFGGIGGEAGAALTRHFGLVRVGLEYVKHEIYQAKVMRHYGQRFVEDFGSHLERLRPGSGAG